MSRTRPSGVRVRAPLVVVADDHDDSRHMYCEYLQFLGCGVIPARDGEEALRLALLTQPQLLVVDVAMPHLTGTEIARRLRADPRTRHTKILALTGFGEAWREHAKRAGCDAFLPKPTPLADLERAVRALLPQLAAQRRAR